MNASGADLALLLHRSGGGDEAAFAELYDATSARTYALARRVLGDVGNADDVLLAAYVEIWRRARRLDEADGSCLAWIMTIVHTTAVGAVRSGRQMRSSAIGVDPARDRREPQTLAVLDAQRLRRLCQGRTSGPNPALYLAYFGAFTHAEVDQILDLEAGEAKRRIRDGLAQIPGLAHQG